MSDVQTQFLRDVVERSYAAADLPALLRQTQQWQDSRPLAGVRIIDATPVFGNTLAKYLPLIAAGADLTVLLSPQLPHDPDTARLLTRAGIPTTDSPQECDIALDCAGVLAAPAARLGHVELTKSGEHVYSDHSKPVYLVDDSRIKVIETSLGTGDGFVRGLAHFGHDDLQGKSVVVFGCGKVGRGAAMRARDAGALVTIVDPDPDARPVAGCELRDSPGEALDSAWCIVTATGVAGALSPLSEQLLASPAILANLGAEDEFGPGIPRNRVLNDKAPVNFALAEPTHLRYLDATIALHNACAVELLTGGQPAGLLPAPQPVEDDILEIVRTHSSIAGELAEVYR